MITWGRRGHSHHCESMQFKWTVKHPLDLLAQRSTPALSSSTGDIKTYASASKLRICGLISTGLQHWIGPGTRKDNRIRTGTENKDTSPGELSLPGPAQVRRIAGFGETKPP